MNYCRKKNQIVPYLFVIALFVALISPYLLTHGMFMDGTIYAAISKNLALENGSFWSLKFMNSIFNPFYEHPPLAFFLESVFFRIFGDYFFIEKVYSCLTYCVSGIIIHFIWKELASLFLLDKKNSWMPMLLLLLFPLISWAAVNNMLENTMTVFILLSLLFLLKSLSNQLVWEILAGLCLSAAFLTKGPIGLYLWSFYFFYFLIFRKGSFNKMVLKTFLFIFYTLVPFVFLYFIYPFGFESLMNYFTHQVVNGVSSVVTVSSRFFILFSLGSQLAIPCFFVLIWAAFRWFGNKQKEKVAFMLRPSVFFLFLGFSGVLPVMISMKQSGFYVLSTFPFFAFSLAIFLSQLPKIHFAKKYHQIFAVFSVFLLVLSVANTVANYGAFSRDEDKIKDIEALKKEVPSMEDIAIEKSLWDDWTFMAYASRYENLSFWREEIPSKKYFLAPKNSPAPNHFIKYEFKNTEMIIYQLFEKKN